MKETVMNKYRITCKVILLALLMVLASAATALAEWPSGAQGDQYGAVNASMASAAADAGISPETFIGIYNAAITGDLTGFTEEQLNACCQVLNSLTSYKSVLVDYDTVYKNLGCSTRLVADPSWRELPSTGTAIIFMVASAVVGIGAAALLLRRENI